MALSLSGKQAENFSRKKHHVIAAIEDIPARLAGSLLGISTHPMGLLLLINVILLIASTFVETTAALILLVPMITAMAPALGVDKAIVKIKKARTCKTPLKNYFILLKGIAEPF